MLIHSPELSAPGAPFRRGVQPSVARFPASHRGRPSHASPGRTDAVAPLSIAARADATTVLVIVNHAAGRAVRQISARSWPRGSPGRSTACLRWGWRPSQRAMVVGRAWRAELGAAPLQGLPDLANRGSAVGRGAAAPPGAEREDRFVPNQPPAGTLHPRVRVATHLHIANFPGQPVPAEEPHPTSIDTSWSLTSSRSAAAHEAGKKGRGRQDAERRRGKTRPSQPRSEVDDHKEPDAVMITDTGPQERARDRWGGTADTEGQAVYRCCGRTGRHRIDRAGPH